MRPDGHIIVSPDSEYTVLLCADCFSLTDEIKITIPDQKLRFPCNIFFKNGFAIQLLRAFRAVCVFKTFASSAGEVVVSASIQDMDMIRFAIDL